MKWPCRGFALSLLMVLLLSLTALATHVATHGAASIQDCELCAGHGNPSHGIPPAQSMSLHAAAVGVSDLPVLLSIDPGFRFHYRQRAPPGIATL